MTEHITCLSEVAITRDPFEASVESCHSPTPSRQVAPITLDSQGQSFAVVQRSLARLSLPYISPLPLTHSISATLPSSVFHKHHKLIPTSGPLHLPFLFLKYSHPSYALSLPTHFTWISTHCPISQKPSLTIQSKIL